MPFAFILVGLVLVISGVKDTSAQLLSLLNGDLRGQNNYIYWMLSIAVVGSLGYIESFRPFSRALLVLLIVVLVLSNDKNGSSGFFTNFQSALSQISNRNATTANTAST
jgi:hypothetical protein